MPLVRRCLGAVAIGYPLGNTLVTAHLKFTTHPGPLVVNRTQHGVSVQGCAPAIIEPRHAMSAPLVYLNKSIGHASVGNQDNFQTATAGRTVCTGRLAARRSGCIDYFLLRALGSMKFADAFIADPNGHMIELVWVTIRHLERFGYNERSFDASVNNIKFDGALFIFGTKIKRVVSTPAHPYTVSILPGR